MSYPRYQLCTLIYPIGIGPRNEPSKVLQLLYELCVIVSQLLFQIFHVWNILGINKLFDTPTALCHIPSSFSIAQSKKAPSFVFSKTPISQVQLLTCPILDAMSFFRSSFKSPLPPGYSQGKSIQKTRLLEYSDIGSSLKAGQLMEAPFSLPLSLPRTSFKISKSSDMGIAQSVLDNVPVDVQK
jgi:hypothetical protein